MATQILFGEDMRSLREIIADFLQTRGYVCAATENDNVAGAGIAEREYQLVRGAIFRAGLVKKTSLFFMLLFLLGFIHSWRRKNSVSATPRGDIFNCALT